MLSQPTNSLRTWVGYLALVGAAIGGALLAVTASQPGETFIDRLQARYEWLWMNTTGRPYTEVLRENPQLLAAASLAILVVVGWALPRKYWGRSIVLYVSLAVGFVAGHVLW